MEINSINTSSCATCNVAAADKQPNVQPAPPSGIKVWTDEELREATLKLRRGERDFDVAGYNMELKRLALLQNQDPFHSLLRNVSEGIIDYDAYLSGASREYDTEIFKKLAEAFSTTRSNMINNYGKYLSDEEVDFCLRSLHEKFDDAFNELSKTISKYAGKDVSKDVKAYGEAIKFYVCSGNSVSKDTDSSELYAYLDKNTKSVQSLNQINEFGMYWYSKVVGNGTNSSGGTRVYGPEAFKQLMADFSAVRNSTMNNYGKYLLDEEVDFRLKNLHEKFDNALNEISRRISKYAGKDVSKDVKAYGEAIRLYVCSGNSISKDTDFSELYAYLGKNTKLPLSLDGINELVKL